MTALSPEQSAYFEKLISEYEQAREDAQNGLRDTMKDLRKKLESIVAKDALADEVAGFRLFVKRRFDAKNHPEKVAKIDDKTQIADAYEFQASQGQVYTTRTRSAGRASRDPVQTEAETDFDAKTGEILELVEGITILDRFGNETTNISGDIADTKSCGVVEGERALNGHEPDRCDGTELAGLHPTIQFEGNGKACVTGTHEDAHPETMPLAFRHEADEPGPQDTNTSRNNDGEHHVTPSPSQNNDIDTLAPILDGRSPGKTVVQPPVPIQRHTAIDGSALSQKPAPVDSRLADEPFVPVGLDIPAQFRRAPVQGNA